MSLNCSVYFEKYSCSVATEQWIVAENFLQNLASSLPLEKIVQTFYSQT
jgi:hypothetical protein